MKIIINGAKIKTEADFHSALVEELALPAHYGRNLDAMWDVLSTDIERPARLVWNESELSRRALGPLFDKIVEVLERVKNQDKDWNLADKFDYSLT